MEKLLVSACLLGVGCRYDGKSVPCADVLALAEKYSVIPFCPEVYGGLTTPRVPSEISEGRVYSADGRDVTMQFERGADEAVRLCKALGIKKAVLKEKSPSCGTGEIYDGSFTGRMTVGDGISAAALRRAGVEVFGESEVRLLL